MDEFLNLNFTEILIDWFINHGIKIILLIVGALILYKIVVKYIIEKGIRIAVVGDKYTSKEAEIKREDTLIRILTATFKVALIILVSLMILQEFNVNIAPILAGAGIIGLALGFGGQYLIRDIISGLFIIIENQYRIGDVVTFDGTSGLVEDISLRKTTLRDMDGTVHHIPHGEIKKVSNFSKNFSRVNLNIGIGYNSNLDKVIQIVNEIGNEMAEDEYWKDLILKAPQFLRVQDLGDSAIVIKILGETEPLKQWEVTGELRKRIIIRFNKEGVEIPFPQRVIHSL
jgi:small-conductance mechanosensitive channel